MYCTRWRVTPTASAMELNVWFPSFSRRSIVSVCDERTIIDFNLLAQRLLKQFHSGQQTLPCDPLLIEPHGCIHRSVPCYLLSNREIPISRFDDGSDCTSATGIHCFPRHA